MKILLSLSVLTLLGCAPAVYPPVVPTPQPGPVEPVPGPQVGLEVYEAVKVGAPELDVLGLPGKPLKAVVGPRTIYAFETTAPRPTGGRIFYEYGVEGGVVVSARPW